MEHEAGFKVTTEGAGEAARAASEVASAWTRATEGVASGVRRAGAAIGGQLQGVAEDMLRTATVMKTIDLGSAVQGARAYREEIAKFGTAAGAGVGVMNVAFDRLSKATLQGEPALAAWAKGVGRLTYNYVGAVLSAKSLHDESVATGKSFDEMGRLGVVMANNLGVTDDMGRALGKIRAQAEQLGTVGGVSAFQDQIQALAGTFSGFATQSDAARDRLTALAGILGKGLAPAQAGQVQSSVLNAIQAQAGPMSYILGREVLNERGEVADPAGTLRDMRKFYQKVLPDKKLRQLFLRGKYGNLAGSAIERADLSESNVDQLARTGLSRSAENAAARYAETDAGRAQATQLQAQRSMRQLAERFVQAQDKFGAAFADNPMAGQVVSGLMQATMRAAVGQIGGLFGGAAAGGAGGGAGGGAAAALAGGLSGATVALGAFTIGLIAAGKVLHDLGAASQKGMDKPPQLLTEEEAKERREKAEKAEAEAPGRRSSGVQRAKEQEDARLRRARVLDVFGEYEAAYQQQRRPKLGRQLMAAIGGPSADPALKLFAESMKAGQLNTKELPRDIAEALVDALGRSPLKAVLQQVPGGAPGAPDEGKNEG